MKQIDEIRKAVCANRGGLDEATDNQIMTIWRALPADVQKQYLKFTAESAETAEKKTKNS